MAKSERQPPYNFGRVFFPSDPNPNPAIPNEIRFQPLGNHVSNVGKLVKKWQPSDFPDHYESSFKRVIKAANLHDIGKPQKFALQVETDSQQKFKKYIYSFRGHRFLAECKDNIWVEKLAQGHHDFSVKDISRDAYVLNKYPEYQSILAKDPLAYARELYILEMCDQIEAELACRVIGDDEQAESRTFMDYTIAKDDSEKNVYRVDPWIFSPDQIELTFDYWLFCLSEGDQAELKKCRTENRDVDLGKKLDAIAKQWWQNQQGQPEKAEPRKVTLKPYSSNKQFQNRDCEFWYQQLAGFEPNPMQKKIFEVIEETENPAFLLKSPTGSGKFEAILFPALSKNSRLILPLPARSLIEDQKQRIEKYLKRFSELNPDREISLVIDTGSQMQRWVYRNGKEESKPRTYNPRRHLYKADVILTTLDKFLYRYFAFGDKQKSFVFPLRIHRDKTGDEKTIICFDEAHSYDEIAFTNFQSLVKSLYEAGRSLILMTATMPQEYISRFDYLETIDYIGTADDSVKAEQLINFQKQHLQQPYLNRRSFEWINDIERNSENPEPFQKRICETVTKEWQSKSNCKIITVVQTVRDAVAIYGQLSDKLKLTENTEYKQLYLYHGRLDHRVRQEVYTQLKQRDDKAQPYILITTSAIEVGCDLNSEVLISEICPPENLIQRAGRCNRKGNFPDAKVIVLGKIEGSRIPFYAQTLEEAEWQDYQETLQQLERFDSHKIAEHITRSQQVDDYRVVELFSMLHDYVYSADLTCQPAHEKGLVVTRSWTPSATLVYDDGTHGNQIENMPQVTVPIDRLTIKKDNINQYANTHVCERYYDQENTSWEMRGLRWGFAYQKEIVIKINQTNDGAFMPDANPEYSYNPELGFVELPGVFIKLRTNGFDEKLLYQYGNTGQKKSVIITYTKALEETT
ncbi:CRISPR-associated helicase Cas3' [Microcoleus sp. Pol11C2]|uniref:CRISPR-associated helicase Cas3' n=1 Tax=Microcoleus sp. Pol11C2 TaxID=3055389 RepID=UPI002FD31050